MLMTSNDRGGEARLHYGANGFRVLRTGSHVVCAVSGARIQLDGLRYWSVKHQEPYATAEIAATRLVP